MFRPFWPAAAFLTLAICATHPIGNRAASAETSAKTNLIQAGDPSGALSLCEREGGGDSENVTSPQPPSLQSSRQRSDWNPQKAATYLDARTTAWMHGGAMDRGTFCMSCHTALPYALARPTLRSALKEPGPSPTEKLLMDSIATRIEHWDNDSPVLGDKTGGPGTESVIYSLILANSPHENELELRAFDLMWSQQIKTGPNAGSWHWHNFGNEPWEAPDSDYWGATLAAVATGTAPDGYLHKPDIQANLALLRDYLRKDWMSRSLFNQAGLLQASTSVPNLLSPQEKSQIARELLAFQHPDGGWNTASLMPASWKRHDGTPESQSSDGYATGLIALALESIPSTKSAVRKAQSWLRDNQDPTTGTWPTESPNAKRDPASDPGKFMTDAATAYATMALANPLLSPPCSNRSTRFSTHAPPPPPTPSSPSKCH